MMRETRQKILEKMLEIDSLPILPDIAFEIMGMSENDIRSMKQISDLVSRDPSITAGVLKVANSAFYGLKKNVGSLDSALIILGLREIKNIVFMMSLFKLFPQDGEFAFDKVDYLKHSIMTAITANKLTQILNIEFNSSPFICGLLHDIGKICLDQYAHQEFLTVIKEAKKKNIFFFEAERQILGIDHAEIGGMLSKIWHFPDDISDAIKYHHSEIKEVNGISMISIINLANLLTNARKIGVVQTGKGIDIKNNPGWINLEKSTPFFKKIDIEKIFFEVDYDLKNSQEVIKMYSSRIF
jgi:putative nucleotidyltransferase with HDIG domain